MIQAKLVATWRHDAEDKICRNPLAGDYDTTDGFGISTKGFF